MELKRRDRMSFVLLILWTIPTITALSGLNLDCTNDYEELMLCHFKAQNCFEYNLTLRSNEGYGEPRCIIKQCKDGPCCCSANMSFVPVESHNATVWKGGDSMESKHINITDTIKPKTPTIISVEESNGNFEVKWRTNHEKKYINDMMMANVTYHIKGDTQEESKWIEPTTHDGLKNYEIPGRVLKPSTTYEVGLIPHCYKFSDRSEEKEFTTRLNLDCTNDYEESMFCHFEAQSCYKYKLTVESTFMPREPRCIFKQCDDGQCCCSFNEMTLVLGESHNATVWKGGDSMESKHIDITDTIKPKTPTIISVEESNGIYEVKWRTNYEKTFFSDSLMAKVTYHIKGDTQEEPKSINLTTHDVLNNYEIPGRDLKPSTTYVVSVKSYTDISDKFSDSSEEKEFTTPVKPVFLPLAIIISLSAVIFTGAIYVCYVKLKTKWWETVAKCPNPKLLIMHPSKQELLEPVPPTISSVCVEPLVPDDSKPWSKGSLSTSSGCLEQSSGFSTGSSCLSNANTEPADIIAGVQDALGKAFANISPVSPLTTNPLAESNKVGGLLSSPYNPCGVRADEMSSGSFGFINKTHSIIIPSCPHQIVTDSSEVQTQAEMLCDSAYHPIAGDVEPSVDQQAPACPLVDFPPVVLSVIPTDMSYQQSNADSGGFPNAEDSSLSSVSSGTNTVASGDPVTRVEAGRESSDEAVQGATKPHGKTEGADENPCYGSVPAGSHSLPPVDDDYQPFHNLVEQPDVLFSEERSDEEEEHLNKYPGESFTEMPQSFLSPVAANFINNVQGDRYLSELQRPFLPLIPADQSKPLFTDSGYQCV